MQDNIDAHRFSIKNMDTSVDPKEDFYRFAAGGWLRTHTLPADTPIFGTFYELVEYSLEQLRGIAEECHSGSGARDGSYERMVGDFYMSAMDTERIESLGFSPIEGMWKKVEDIDSSEGLARLVPELHMCGVPVFFSTYSSTDSKNSKIYALYLFQGGLSLPDREYYLQDSFSQIRKDFLEHIERMFILKGIDRGTAHDWSAKVLEIETEMAKGSRSVTELRDDNKNYNQINIESIGGRYAALGIAHYLKKLEVPDVPYVVIGQPEYFEMLDRLFVERGADGLRPYLYWKVIHTYAEFLHSAVDSENFDMFNRKIKGQKEQRARWKRAISVIDLGVGEAMGSLYVKRYFSPDAKRRVHEMVDDLSEAFGKRIRSLSWMSDATRNRALNKLRKINVMVGYPERFRDYAGLKIDPKDYAGNVMRSVAFELRRQTRRAGGHVDKKEWSMVPQVVNAYYSSEDNSIVLPAGILQPPFFDMSMDDAVNYGGIGAIIGHEMTHGFDDQGRVHDEYGNLNDWWTTEDAKRFRELAQYVVREYSSHEVLRGHFINGEMTLGENLADLGGVEIAYDAMVIRQGKEPGRSRVVDGFTPEQRFFIAYAQIYKMLISDEDKLRRLVVDVHSPAEYRAIIPPTNHKEFSTAFKPQNGKEGMTGRWIGVW